VRNLTITGGSITASSSRYGAGIGAGIAESESSCANIGDLTILGGHVTATSESGAAIGGGYTRSGSANVTRLRISNAVVEAGASSIGGGSGSHSTVSDLVIFDSNLSVSNFSGIQSLTFGDRVSLDCVGTDVCLETRPSIVPNAVIAVRIRSGRVFSSNTSIGKEGAMGLTIMYDRQTRSISEDLPDSKLFTYVQIGKVRLPSDWIWDTCIRSESFSHCFSFNSSRSQSFVVFVRRHQIYTLSVVLESLRGRLETETNSSFWVFDDPLFLTEAHFV
jgi:hypothetical protein